MAGENCISDNLIALCMPNQGTKGEITVLTSHFLPYPLLLLSSLLHPSPSSPFLPSPLPFIVFPRLASPAPPLPLLDSPLRVEDLLADPDPTHKRRVDNQLPRSSVLNRSSSEFPREAMPFPKADCCPLSPHLLSHSSPIFGSLIPHSFWFLRFRSPRQAIAGRIVFSLR